MHIFFSEDCPTSQNGWKWDSCCTKDSPCGEGHGDCDEWKNDEDCLGELKCGSDNCKALSLGPTYWSNSVDCCYHPLGGNKIFQTPKLFIFAFTNFEFTHAKENVR